MLFVLCRFVAAGGRPCCLFKLKWHSWTFLPELGAAGEYSSLVLVMLPKTKSPCTILAHACQNCFFFSYTSAIAGVSRWQQVSKSLWDSPCPCEQQEIKFRSIRSLQCNLKLDWLLTRYIYHCQCEPVHFHVPNAGSINVIANKASSWIPKKADAQTLFILPWYWKWNSSDNRLFLSLWMYMGKTQIHVFYSLSSMKAILYFKC